MGKIPRRWVSGEQLLVQCRRRSEEDVEKIRLCATLCLFPREQSYLAVIRAVFQLAVRVVAG